MYVCAPWRIVIDSTNQEYNEQDFAQWYNKMVEVTQKIPRVSLPLLEKYSFIYMLVSATTTAIFTHIL